MNETQKTGIFAAIAALAVLLAFVTRPVSITKEDEKGGLAAGDLLFKDEASDVTKATSLKITKFDENKLSMESFEVVRDKDTGLWKIPSEYSYPADAEEQLKNATSPLAGMKILNVIEDAGRSDHALYGVVEPSDKLEAGVTGVGMMVNVADSTGKSMASLIIGKKIEGPQENLHYVRIPNQDPVYTVEIDTSVFNTDFKKWIKPDLLTVKGFDINGIGIRDYRTQQRQTAQGVSVGMERTMEADFSYDANTNKWNLDRLVAFDGKDEKPDQIAEGDEVKSDKLNSIRNAAQSLQIVGVRPKPKGLAADLKADKALLENQESMISLLDQGFVPYAAGDTTEILATAGETILTTRDGVRYTLRFGEESVVSAGVDAAAADGKDESAASKRERYLLVTASVDESRFPAPELQPIPQTIEELKKMDEEKAAAEAAKKAAAEAPAMPPAAPAQDEAPKTEEQPKPEEPKPEEPKAEEPKPEAPKPEEPKAEEPKPEEPKAEASAEEPKGEEPKAEELEADELEEETDEGAADDQDPAAQEPAAQDPAVAPPAETKPAEPAAPAPASAPAADAKPADQKPAEAKPLTDEELKDRLSVVQSDITKANQRLIDARNDKLTAARKKVQELNARFADWYYLIDDSSFKQLMLKRDVLIGPKAAPAAPGAPGAPSFPGAPPSIPGLNLPQ